MARADGALRWGCERVWPRQCQPAVVFLGAPRRKNSQLIHHTSTQPSARTILSDNTCKRRPPLAAPAVTREPVTPLSTHTRALVITAVAPMGKLVRLIATTSVFLFSIAHTYNKHTPTHPSVHLFIPTCLNEWVSSSGGFEMCDLL